MRSNQGFASVIATFPQGAFMTCRYPHSAAEQRRHPEENTWHPQQAGVAEEQPKMPNPPHNTTGTKPLPIPFNQRPGYEEEEAKEAAAKLAKYEAFKALRLSNTGGDVIPADFHEHTIYSAVHAATEHQAGEIFRPSKPRIGTTPHERAAAAEKLAREQREAEQIGRARQEEEAAAAAAGAEAARQRQLRHHHQQHQQQQQQQGGYEEDWRPAAYDPSRAQRTNGQQPTHYNIPARSFPPAQRY